MIVFKAAVGVLRAGLGVVLGTLALQANVVLDWNAVMMAGIRLDNTGPTLSTRNLAILHLAVYDAVTTIARTHQPYQVQAVPAPGSSLEAAAASAGYEVLKVLYPGVRARSEETFQTWLSGAPKDLSVTNGLAFGRSVALATLALRAADGAATEVPYIPSNHPGQWRRTPPFFRPPLTPHWRYVQPFAVPDIDAFVPGPPPALDSAEYARDLNEVKAIGARNSAIRTDEQSLIAVFWSDFSYTAMPPGHWHEIAATIARDRGTGLADTARLMALLSLAQADAAIVCWEAKYRYNLWRPVTAIQRADEDGNPETEADPGWVHYLAAPPFPAYTSGHSTFSKASAEVLAAFYGTDEITFTATSDSLPGVFRSYQSLAACADEVGMSRIYGGIHYAFDNVLGKACGAQVARYVVANFLLPEEALPLAWIEGVTPATVEVRVHGHVGRSCVLEASTNLRDWSAVARATAAPGGMIVGDPRDGAGMRFYRVREE
jgi:hypothetical protein